MTYGQVAATGGPDASHSEPPWHARLVGSLARALGSLGKLRVRADKHTQPPRLVRREPVDQAMQVFVVAR